MIHPERGVTIETWAVVSDATSVEYLVSRDGEAVEFSLGQSSRTSGLSLLVTPDGLRRPGVFTPIFMIMVSEGVGTAKGARELR
jgi:hypothetical protein